MARSRAGFLSIIYFNFPGGGLLVHRSLKDRDGSRGLLSKPRILVAAVLLVVAVCFGGGGSGAGAANLIVQLAALAALAFHRRAVSQLFMQAPRGFVVVLAVTVLLPMMQCIPLPPAVWQQLPGRDLAVQSLTLVGQQDSWMPFSLNVRRTFIAFLALMPPLAMLTLTWSASDTDRRALLTILVGCGAVGIILGTQQLASGNREFMLYAEAIGSPDLHGTFANRNSAGLFADVSLCALIGLLWQPRHNLLHLGVGVAVGILLGLGLFLTRSRSAMTLVIIPVAMLIAYLWSSRGELLGRRSRLIALITTIAVIVVSAGLVTNNARIQHSLSRFETLQDVRPLIWQDTELSIARFWPVGSGIGTFDEVFQLDETLENLSPGRAARAHNEFLETMLESGVLGLVLVCCWTLVIVLKAWRCVRYATDRGSRIAALAVFILLAFQSILDYPLRSQTLLCVAGLMVGILIARPSADTNVEARKL